MKRAVNDMDSLAEAGQVLHHLGDERESAGGAFGRVLLHQVEEGGRHDGWAHEAQEQGGADEAVGQILPTTLSTSGSPRGKHFLQLPGKDAEIETEIHYLLSPKRTAEEI